MRLPTRLARLVIVLPLIAGLLSCGESTSPQAGTAVNVKDNEFEPRNLLVSPGQTVTWTWSGTSQHSVTFDNAAVGSSLTQVSGVFTRVFQAAGIFTYHCVVHGTAMSGTITVQ